MPETNVVFYKEDDGSVPVLDWLIDLNARDKEAVYKCQARIEALAVQGHELRRPIADLLRDDIHELRIKKGRVQYRILYAFHGRQVAVLVNACSKEDVVPPAEIDRAVERLKRFGRDPAKHTYREG